MANDPNTKQELDRISRPPQAVAKPSDQRLPRGSKTICIPCDPEHYPQLVGDPARFRRYMDSLWPKHPELFPAAMAGGYQFHDFTPPSVKLGVRLRRIKLTATREVYSVCPSFIMPYMVGYVAEVDHALFLMSFGVPYWALTHVFGRNDMYWYRLGVAWGRNSLVGTTVKDPERLPPDLLADEKHTTHRGDKAYVATTVGADCTLGVAVCHGADAPELTQGYGVFAAEARNVDPAYAPKTVNTDGWEATQLAWKALFPTITVILCFLHAFINIRDRCKSWGERFYQIGERVWGAYHAPTKRGFAQRLRRLREWAERTLEPGVVRDKILALCAKAPRFALAYDHPNAHRTSNLLDRLMRWQDRFLFNRQYFHRSGEAAELGIRAWALLRNFRPYSPRTLTQRPQAPPARCPAERLNGFRYRQNWLENLRVAASMGGYRQ